MALLIALQHDASAAISHRISVAKWTWISIDCGISSTNAFVIAQTR